MRKEIFENAEMEVIEFKLEDVILTSGEDDYEGDNPYTNNNITPPSLL